MPTANQQKRQTTIGIHKTNPNHNHKHKTRTQRNMDKRKQDQPNKKSIIDYIITSNNVSKNIIESEPITGNKRSDHNIITAQININEPKKQDNQMEERIKRTMEKIQR